jgi:glycosyltransferase involved in cell wall biosynthesis
MPSITVCMAAHNAADTIAAACRSIINQTETDWQLVVVDDGSKDTTAAIVEGLNDPRIILVRNPSSLGLAQSLNVAVDHAGGDYIARMDADDLAFPERLALQTSFMRTNPDIDLVGGNAMVFDDLKGLMGCTTVPGQHVSICRKPERGMPILHPTWFGKTAWFAENRYDPAFSRAQDYELLFRTRRHSRFANIPDVVLAYRYAALNAAKRRRAREFMIQTLKMHSAPGLALTVDVGRLKAISLVDDVLDQVGLGDRLAQRRLAPVSVDASKRWADLTRAVES